MTLTITHQETIRLAQELADLTGETPAAAIALALKDRLLLEREEREWEEARRARMAIPEFGYGLGIGIAARRARMAIPPLPMPFGTPAPGSPRAHGNPPSKSGSPKSAP